MLTIEQFRSSELADLYFVADKNPEAFEAFDRTFPEKQKQKLPGQLF